MELMDREGLADAARHALLELVPPAIALVRVGIECYIKFCLSGLPAAGRRLPKHSSGLAAAQAPVSPEMELPASRRQGCVPAP